MGNTIAAGVAMCMDAGEQEEDVMFMVAGDREVPVILPDMSGNGTVNPNPAMKMNMMMRTGTIREDIMVIDTLIARKDWFTRSAETFRWKCPTADTFCPGKKMCSRSVFADRTLMSMSWTMLLTPMTSP